MSYRKRLVIDTRMQSHTGIGRVVKNLLPRIKAGLGHVDIQLIEEDIPIYSLKEQWVLPRLIKGADLFWAPHFNVPIRSSTPYVVTIHDMAHRDLPEHANNVFKQIYVKATMGCIAKEAKSIVCVSEFTKSRWLHYYPDSAFKTKVIHHGAPDGYMPSSNKSETPYFLFIGNIKPHKNLTTLLKAFDDVKGDIPHDLYVVGQYDGLKTQDVKAWRMLEALKPRVKVLGKVDDAALKQTLAEADALVFPSHYEGFGIPPLEAMASGVPVIAANIASIPEVCGDAVLYCDPKSDADLASKLRMFARDEELRRQFSEKGKQRLKQFSWDLAAESYTSIFKRYL